MSGMNAYWRDSARPPRFFFIDAMAAFPLILFLLHIRLWTLGIAIASMIFFAVLERFKFTIPVFFRWVRSNIAGPIRVSRPPWRE